MSDIFNNKKKQSETTLRETTKTVHTDLKGRNGNVIYVSRK